MYILIYNFFFSLNIYNCTSYYYYSSNPTTNPNMSSEGIERVQNNTSTISNRSRKNINRPRNRGGPNKQQNGKDGTIPIKKQGNNTRPKKNPPKTRVISPQRTTEIAQCQYLLSRKQFKLFKDGGHVSSYGFTPTHRSREKYIVNIPYEYPKQPLKIDIDIESISQQDQLKYNNLIRNFNNKCKNDTKNNVKTPIISQLNYLLNSKESLMNNSTQDFNNLTTLKSSFYNQFV